MPLLGILILPLAIFYVFEVEPFSIYTQVDSFIYTGYSQNLPDLVSRYGVPYFAVRFGLILPSRLAFELFGPVGGHFVLRYLLAAACAAIIYLLARRNGCRAAGWFGAIIFLSSPVLLRALMSEYSDTTGLPLLLIGIGCLMMPTSRRLWWAIPAGLSFGLAINSSLFIAAVVAAALLARVTLQLLRRDFAALWTYAVVAGGISFVTGAGAAYYRLTVHHTDILRPSLAWLKNNSGQAVRSFRSPSYAWLDFSLYLYMPVLVTVALFLVLIMQRSERDKPRLKSILDSPATDALAMLLAVEAFYVLYEFVLQGYSLEYFFYASYLWAFVGLGLTLLVVELARRREAGARLAWLGFGVAIALPVARNLFFKDFAFWAWPAVLLMIGVVAIPFAWPRNHPAASQLGVVGLVVSVVLLGMSPPHNPPLSPHQTVRADPHYETAIGSSSQLGIDYLKLSSQLIKDTPKWTNDPGTVLFWYPSSPQVLNLMQSVYLWLPDTVQGNGPGLPSLSTSQSRELLGRTPRTIIMLVLQLTDISRGRSALLATGLQPIRITDRRLHAGAFTVYTEQLTFKAASCDQGWRTYTWWTDLSPICS